MYRRSVTALRGSLEAILLNSDSLILKKSAACPCDLLEDRGLQEGVQAGVLVAPHAFQPSLSGPAVPDFLGDFLEQAAETVGEPLFGASNGPTGAPYSRHVPVRPG